MQNSYFLFLNACIYTFIHEWTWIKVKFWIYLNLCIFIGLLKESTPDFWIAKTPKNNYLAGFCWLWGNTFFLVSALSCVKSAILLASIFYATSGYVYLSIFTNFYRLVIDFYLLLNVKQEVFTVMLCILPTIDKTQEPFFDQLEKQMEEDYF